MKSSFNKIPFKNYAKKKSIKTHKDAFCTVVLAKKFWLFVSPWVFFSGVYISFETHIFAPPPFFRIIFFPLTHGLKTGVFDRFLMPAQTSKKIFGF